MITLTDYESIVDILFIDWLPKAEVWVVNYLPNGQVYKLVLKDLPLIYNFKGYFPGTEKIYLISTEDFSMELSQILINACIPVFSPGGERLQ